MESHTTGERIRPRAGDKGRSGARSSGQPMNATAVVVEESELDLVERHRYGDPAAFEAIYERFERMVYNLALRMCADPDEASDLSQEVFLRVYRHLSGFRGGSSLKTWIYRVTVNCCRSHLRRRRWPWTSRRARLEDHLVRLPDPAPGPEAAALNRDLGERLGAALAAIPLPFREAVVLRDVHGLSYEEVAGVLRVRPGTVRSRIARGRERLRLLLEESG